MMTYYARHYGEYHAYKTKRERDAACLAPYWVPVLSTDNGLKKAFRRFSVIGHDLPEFGWQGYQTRHRRFSEKMRSIDQTYGGIITWQD
jgi:hypothetical protein